jgi:hypothetical protein
MPHPQAFLAGKPQPHCMDQSSGVSYLLKLMQHIITYNIIISHAKNEGMSDNHPFFEEQKKASLGARNNFVHTYIFMFGWMTKKAVKLIFKCVLNNIPEFASFSNSDVIYSQMCQAYVKSLSSSPLPADDILTLKKLYDSSNAQFIMETRGLMDFNHLCFILTDHYNSLH